MAWITMRRLILATMVLGLSAAAGGRAHAGFLGPTPYLGFADSPFQGASFSYFHLEDFEDLALNTPGVTANTGSVFGPGADFPSSTDSVDEDDGAIDGSGSRGHSFGVAFGNPALTFSFDAAILGSLPTAVGIVFTDGFNPSFFEAFDAAGVSLGLFGPYSYFAGLGSQVQGDTVEDHFIGFTHAGGISRIEASTTGEGGLEVDHLQYGLLRPSAAVPEPSSIALCGLAVLVGLGIRARRPRR